MRTDFQKRVDYAARAFTIGKTDSRKMDNCFEMFDGDAVVAALVRRAEKNPNLHAGIAKAFSSGFPASWIETAQKYEGQNLQKVSDSLIYNNPFNVEQRRAVELRTQGLPVRIAALGIDDKVHVLFSFDERKENCVGYYMSEQVYAAFPLLTATTPDDYRKHGELVEAPDSFH